MTTIVSYSEIYKFQTCKRQYYYKHILGRTPLEMGDAPSTGTKGHKLLQHFYEFLSEGKNKEEALLLVTERATKDMLAEGFADSQLLKAWTLVDNYIRANEFTSEAVLIENRFLIPASILDNDPMLEDVQIGFTPDVVFKRKGDFYDVEDYKFIQRAWPNKKIDRLPQIKLYQIFLEHMGYDISRTILRFFNVTTGKLSHKAYTLNDAEREILTRDFMAGVKDVVQYKTGNTFDKAPRTMNYGACQFCDYDFVCGLEAEGKDATKTLNSQYKDNTYDYTR